MKHTLFRAVVLLATAALALAACAQPTPAPAPTEPPPAQATSEEPMAEEPTAEPPMAEEVTVVIGFTSSLTGSQEVSSKRQVNGFNLWMEQLNAAGGITLSDGTVVTFAASTYDDESNAERVQELYTRLITEDNADFLISPYSSGLTSAASIVAEQNGKVMITTGAADDSAYKTGNTSLFQLYTPGSLYMSSTVDMLQEIDPDAKIALVHESDKFSTSVIEGIKPYLAARNFEVVLEEGYASDTADFGPIVNKIAGSGATVLLGGGHYNDGTALARTIYDRNIGLDFVFLLVAPADTKFPELGDAALGVATSYAEARGLMQVIPSTGQAIADQLGWPPGYDTEDLYRPVVSVRFGSHYLREQLDRFQGDPFAALAAYNAGPGNAILWKELAPDDPDLFLEVVRLEQPQLYIRTIYEVYAIYRHLYGSG